MKILYLHQYYKTPKSGGPLRSYYLTNALVEAGHDVEIITAHNDSEYKLESSKNLKIHYLPVKYDNSMGFASRIKAFYSFVRKSKKLSKSIKEIDLCFATSTPLTIGLVALHLKKTRNIPYIFEVRDLWPEAPIQIGAIKNPFLKKKLYKLELKIYDEAQKIVALSPGIREYIREIVPEKPIAVVTNMADCDYFQPNIKNSSVLKRYNVKDELVITYFGAFGKANDLNNLIKCAENSGLRFKGRVRFLLVGGGAEFDSINEQSKHLSNITVIPHRTREELNEILSITDLSYISFRSLPVLETSSPNKFFDSLAAGKACIVNFNGWIKDLIISHNCGFFHQTNTFEEFNFIIDQILKDRGILMRYQRNSRQLAQDYFSKDMQCDIFVQFISSEKNIASLEPSVYTLTA